MPKYKTIKHCSSLTKPLSYNRLRKSEVTAASKNKNNIYKSKNDWNVTSAI